MDMCCAVSIYIFLVRLSPMFDCIVQPGDTDKETVKMSRHIE